MPNRNFAEGLSRKLDMEILFIVWAWVWPVVLACYLVVGVDNEALVDRGREAWLLINGGGT